MASEIRTCLTDEGKLDLALALILLKDYKSQGKWDSDVSLTIIKFATSLGVRKEFTELLSKVPPMLIKPKGDL